jgi:hypothetical protein
MTGMGGSCLGTNRLSVIARARPEAIYAVEGMTREMAAIGGTVCAWKDSQAWNE